MKNIFDPTWERVRSFTGWRKYKDLADFLGLTKGTISGCKARGTFPREYAEALSQKFGKSIDWILTGIGPENTGPEIYNAAYEAKERIRLLETYRRINPDPSEPEPDGDGLSVAEYLEAISKITRGMIRAEEARTEIKGVVGILGDQIEKITTEREQDLMDRKLLQRLVNRVDQLESELKQIKDRNDRLVQELEKIKGEPPPPEKDGTNF